MIREDLTREKSLRKAEHLYGLSLVYFVQEYAKIIKVINNLCDYKKFFVLNEPNTYHITLLRCHSIETDFVLSKTNHFEELISTKTAFYLHGEKIELGIDGVLRLKLDCIPLNYWKHSDIYTIEINTGLQYKIINNPWITLGYTQINCIKKVIEEYDKINTILENNLFYYSFFINQFYLVKYNNTSFNDYQILKSFEVKE